jgi:hypothetical protein
MPKLRKPIQESQSGGEVMSLWNSTIQDTPSEKGLEAYEITFDKHNPKGYGQKCDYCCKGEELEATWRTEIAEERANDGEMVYTCGDCHENVLEYFIERLPC